MLKTNLQRIIDNGPCEGGFKKLVDSLGGIGEVPLDKDQLNPAVSFVDELMGKDNE